MVAERLADALAGAGGTSWAVRTLQTVNVDDLLYFLGYHITDVGQSVPGGRFEVLLQMTEVAAWYSSDWDRIDRILLGKT
jgi:hypothetical protein